MSPIVFALTAGVAFGVIDILLMIPMDLPDKKVAMTGAFFNRFAIGFLVPLVKMHAPEWVIGAVVGLLISLPDAIITKAYGPIIGVGILGGTVIGWAAGRWIT